MMRIRELVSSKRLMLSLVIVLSVVYFVQLVSVAIWSIDTSIYWFVFTPGFVPTPAWILSLFAHGSVSHLAQNILALVVYGSILERYVSKKIYMTVYILSGFIAGFVHTNITQNTGAGASGAIFGLIGFYGIIYLIDHRSGWGKPEENIRYLLALFVPGVVAVHTIRDLYLTTGAGNYAHVVGAIVGGILAMVVLYSEKSS